MDKRQTEHFNRIKKCKEFFDSKDTELRAFDPMDEQLDIFNGRLGPLNDAIAAQKKDITGVTTDTNNLSDAMVKIVQKWAKLGRAYAHSITPKDETFFAQLNHPESEFDALGKAERIGLARNMKTALAGKVTPMTSYGLTDGIITNIGKAIDNYDNDQAAPEDARDVKTQASIDVDDQLNDQDDTLLIMSNLMSNWDETNPGLITAFEIAYKIDNLPSSPTAVKIIFTDRNGNPLANVLSTIVQLNKTFTSNLSGNALLQRFKPGEYTLTAILPGFQPYSKTTRFRRGKTLSLEITLQAV